MKKLLIGLFVIAAAVGAYLYLGPADDRKVGEANLVVSQSDEGVPTPVPSDTPLPLVLTDGTYKLVIASSSMTWEGRKTLIVDYIDKGTVALKAGSATVKDGKITGGSVTIDLATIAVISNGLGKGEDTEVTHLKSADFFDVAKYPTAKFAFDTIAPASASGQFTVNGKLTIKGVTNPVSFPAVLSSAGDTLTMKATVPLDRTLWGLKYASGKFFKDLGDKVIGDEIVISFTVVGRLLK